MNRDLYALHDSDEDKRETEGMFLVTPEYAHELNSQGYGIHWTINDFNQKRKKKENLHKINSWYFEMDGIPKPRQLQLIDRGLIPSLVVESKNGFHVYFDCRDGDFFNPYPQIQARLTEFYQADPNCRHALSKTARCPGYMHMKQPNDPYPVNIVWQYPVTYTPKQMLYFYPKAKAELEKNEKPKPKKSFACGDSLSDKVYNFNCIEALTRLSGSAWVGNETYTFRPAGRGHHNIVVNGKTSSCFIDSSGRIGSSSKGGPTIWQWLRWYGHSDKTILQILKAHIPELFD